MSIRTLTLDREARAALTIQRSWGVFCRRKRSRRFMMTRFLLEAKEEVERVGAIEIPWLVRMSAFERAKIAALEHHYFSQLTAKFFSSMSLPTVVAVDVLMQYYLIQHALMFEEEATRACLVQIFALTTADHMKQIISYETLSDFEPRHQIESLPAAKPRIANPLAHSVLLKKFANEGSLALRRKIKFSECAKRANIAPQPPVAAGIAK